MPSLVVNDPSLKVGSAAIARHGATISPNSRIACDMVFTRMDHSSLRGSSDFLSRRPRDIWLMPLVEGLAAIALPPQSLVRDRDQGKYHPNRSPLANSEDQALRCCPGGRW